MINQCQVLLELSEKNGSFTGMDAHAAGVLKYSSRITELRQRGYTVECKIESGINRYGRAVRYGRYTVTPPEVSA